MPAYRNKLTEIKRDNFIISTPKADSNSRFYCSICGHCFVSEADHKRHTQATHPNEDATALPSSSARASKRRSTKSIKTVFACSDPACGKVTRSRTTMDNHYERFPTHLNPCSSSSAKPSSASIVPSDFISFALVQAFIPLNLRQGLYPLISMMPLWVGFSAGLFTMDKETIVLDSFWELLCSWALEDHSQGFVRKIRQGKAIADFKLQQQLVFTLCQLAVKSNPNYTAPVFPMTLEDSQMYAQMYAMQVAEVDRASKEADEQWSKPMDVPVEDFQSFLGTFCPPPAALIEDTPQEQQQKPIAEFTFPQTFDALPSLGPDSTFPSDPLVSEPNWMSFDMFSGVENLPSGLFSFDNMGYQLSPAPLSGSAENLLFMDPFASYNASVQQEQLQPNQAYSYEEPSLTLDPSALFNTDSSLDYLLTLGGY